MNIYHTKSELLLLYLKKYKPQYTKLFSLEEVYKYAPRWVPGKGINKVCLMYRGDLRDDIKLPKWEGELYVLGECSKGQELILDIYNLLPEFKQCKRLFDRQCLFYLEKRYKKAPLIAEWELSVLLDWTANETPNLPLSTSQVKEVLQVQDPSLGEVEAYKKLWGTKRGAEFLYRLEDSKLWVLIHHGLKFHLEWATLKNTELLYQLQLVIDRCNNGAPIKEEAIMFNSLISKYTTAKTFN